MRDQPDIITYAESLKYPPGLWMLDPIMLGEEDATLRIYRAERNGEIRATILLETVLSSLLSAETAEITKFITEALRRDQHFPGAGATWINHTRQLVVLLDFRPPFYSTPTTYCGKPQLRMGEAFARGKALTAILTEAMTDIDTSEDPVNEFIAKYTTARLRYAASR